MTDENRETHPIRGKLANGLYAEEVVLSHESVVFRLYAGRAFEPAELAVYALRDDVGTAYTSVLPADAVEGRFELAFAPGPPRDWRSFSLSAPGHALHAVREWEDDEGPAQLS